jgi:hypothetical protein
MRRSGWWAILGGVVGGGVGWLIAWGLAGADVHQIGDWRGGALRFIGLVTTVGIAVGYIVVSRLTRGVAVSRDGFTLSYRPLEPVASGYRELAALSVSDLVERLRAVGYAPVLEACDELGQRKAAGDASMPLAGANVALTDPGVRGWIRVQLSVPAEGQTRALGLLEIWSERGDSAQELGLFTLRALGELVGSLAASRESSRLSEDAVGMLTAGLADRPIHRRA